MLHNINYNNILSIDSSSQYNIVVILYNNTLYYQIDKCIKNHEQNILTTIKTLLLKYHIEIKDFQTISFISGPGSFTGIRLSASIAQGLSILHNTHLVSISTLKVLAEQVWRIYKIKKIIVCNTANKNQLYWVQYTRDDVNSWLGKEVLLNIKEALKKICHLQEKWYMIGTGTIHFLNLKNSFLHIIQTKQPYVKDIITLTKIEIKKKNFLPLEYIKLNYLNYPIS